jgi:hypothetical protein
MFLVTINRNISNEEFDNIIANLKRKKIIYKIDSWNYKNILFDRKPEFFIGVSQIIELYAEFPVNTITDVVDKISKYKIKKINSKIKKDLKFHEKAIEDRFLRKNKFDEKGITLYLEAKHRLGHDFCRIGKIILEQENNNIKKEISLLLENTTNSKEIADFLRLGVALNCKIFFKTNTDISEVIRDAKKIFKSNKSNYIIISDLKEITDYYLIGFSLWAKESEKSLLTVNESKIMLLFGNENRGLLKETLDVCNKTIYLGPKSSEPLRANQAAAYAYGILMNKFQNTFSNHFNQSLLDIS